MYEAAKEPAGADEDRNEVDQDGRTGHDGKINRPATIREHGVEYVKLQCDCKDCSVGDDEQGCYKHPLPYGKRAAEECNTSARESKRYCGFRRRENEDRTEHGADKDVQDDAWKARIAEACVQLDHEIERKGVAKEGVIRPHADSCEEACDIEHHVNRRFGRGGEADLVNAFEEKPCAEKIAECPEEIVGIANAEWEEMV